MIDLSPEHLAEVRRILASLAPDLEVLAFGSRVRGAARAYSDLDLALRGPAPLDPRRLAALKDAFAESDLPFSVDVLDWRAVSPEFRRTVEEGWERLQAPPAEGQDHAAPA